MLGKMATTRETATYTAIEAAAEVGVSYRMLDYWLRQGYITIEGGAAGSGSRRTLTASEVERLRRCVRKLRQAQEVVEEFSSGMMWMMEGRAE